MHYQNIANNFIFIHTILRIYKVKLPDIKIFLFRRYIMILRIGNMYFHYLISNINLIIF